MRPVALHLTDVKQWRQALQHGPLTNAKRGVKAKAKRAASPAKGGASSDAGSSSSTVAPPKKIVRGTMYAKKPDGEPPWPPMRLNGRHPIGWHESGSRNTLCDYPCCNDLKKASERKPAGESGTSTPKPGSMPPPPPRGKKTPSAGGSDRAPSPAPSDASSNASTASTRGGATKMFCKTCYDASNSRPMNFHAECWNAWHGLDECVEIDDD